MDFKALIGYQDFATLLQTAFDRLKAAGSRITNLNVGGAFRTLLELAMQGLADMHGLLLAVIPMGYVDYAKGQWLDLKASDVGLIRKPAVKAVGTVTFSRNVAGAALNIPTRTVVKTDALSTGEELRFRVTQDTVMPAGALSVAVPIEAEFVGVAHNVGTAAIKYLVTFIAGIDSVSNPDGWLVTAGADVEDDASLRERYALTWEALAQGGTAGAYASWALAVTGVISASVDDAQPRGPGTVDIYISGTIGTPTQQLIDDVQTAIDLRKSLIADVLVKGPSTVAVNYEVTLYLPAVGGDPVATQAEAEKLITALHTRDDSTGVTPLGIGEDLFRARLISLLMFSPVANVVVTSPAADVEIGAGQLAALGTVIVTVQRVAAA